MVEMAAVVNHRLIQVSFVKGAVRAMTTAMVNEMATMAPRSKTLLAKTSPDDLVQSSLVTATTSRSPTGQR